MIQPLLRRHGEHGDRSAPDEPLDDGRLRHGPHLAVSLLETGILIAGIEASAEQFVPKELAPMQVEDCGPPGRRIRRRPAKPIRGALAKQRLNHVINVCF